MLRGVFRVAVHHGAGLPASQVLQLVAARAGLPMPRRPGMAQIMKAEIANSRPPERRLPGRIGELPADRLPLVGEAKLRVLAQRAPKDAHRLLTGLERPRVLQCNRGLDR